MSFLPKTSDFKLTPFESHVAEAYRTTEPQLTTLQLNITRRCNLACRHCHLACGPQRDEEMTRADLALALDIFERDGFQVLDITGGAPELHPQFRWLIAEAARRGIHTLVRCNLAVLTEPGNEDLTAEYARLGVEVVASLPCYTRENVEAQRGRGTYARDIAVLHRLNSLGYGDREHPELVLDLVYNPGDAFLPAAQADLEAAYREHLDEQGIVFSHLFTITNMPLGRFRTQLDEEGKRSMYRMLLEQKFNEATVPVMMCRTQVSVAPDGTLYDCDFNQVAGALDQGLPLRDESGAVLHLRDFADRPLGTAVRVIRFGDHCYACCAGAGSSCTGATA